MPLNGLTSGQDVKLTITDLNGVQEFAILQDFNSKEDAQVSKEIGIDGNVRHPKFHQGGSGDFTIQRSTPLVDKYFANQEASYYLGSDQLPVTITKTITENDGTVTQLQYTNVVMTLSDSGTYSGTEIVKQKVSFMYSRLLLLA